MQKKNNRALLPDLKKPLVICSVIGALLLGMFLATAFAVGEIGLIQQYGILLCAVYAVTVGVIVAAYLIRYRRIFSADEAAELMSTEISDMFRYVVDIPYAIVNDEGTVKIVSGALQDVLQFRSPVCNVPLSSFCSVPIKDVVAYAQNGGPVKDITFNEDGVPIDHTKPMITEIDGKKYGLRCYILRSRGKDYYFIVFNDITDLEALRKTMYENEPIVAYIVIDSLQELAQYIRVSYRTAVNEIEAKLKEWAASFGGMLREYEREKYLLVFTRAALDRCVRGKFRILDTIRSIRLGDNSFPVTVSIGV